MFLAQRSAEARWLGACLDDVVLSKGVPLIYLHMLADGGTVDASLQRGGKPDLLIRIESRRCSGRLTDYPTTILR